MTNVEPVSDIQGRALIFDEDSIWAEAAKKMLEMRDFLADIETDDFQKCCVMAERTLYHVAIINVHSLKDDARNQLRYFRRCSPASRIILTQQIEDPNVVSLLWPPDPIADYLFGVKEYRPVPEIGKLAQEVIRLYGMLPRDISIILPKNIDSILDTYSESWSGRARKRSSVSLNVTKEELRIIIGRLFSPSAGGEPIAREIRVDAFEESGKSASLMFRVSPRTILGATQSKSAVLKFGPKDETNIEAYNYDKFVEWFLTVDQTVRKISYAEANYFGGILYSYPRDVEGGYEPYADYIRKNDEEKCVAIIEKMFNTENQHWLSVDGNRFVDQDMTVFTKYYVDHVLHASLYEMKTVHFNKLREEVANLERKMQMRGDVWRVTDEKITFPQLSVVVPNAISYLGKPLVERLKLTVIHGDLHAHNILIDTDKADRYFFIDFYYTGYGDIYRDFIELELSVRYDLFSSRELPHDKRLTASDCETTNTDGLKKLVRLEKALIDCTVLERPLRDPEVQNNPDLHKAFRIISEIRRFAFENYPEKKKVYYMGLIFSSLKALKYFYPLDVKIHRLIISGLYLDELQKEHIT